MKKRNPQRMKLVGICFDSSYRFNRWSRKARNKVLVRILVDAPKYFGPSLDFRSNTFI